MPTVVYLVSRDTVINASGDWVSGGTYIPILAGNITAKITRELTILPIPVFGVAAAIDYNVRRTQITIEDIMLVTGVGGNSIGGSVSGTKGWRLKGVTYTAGGSPNLNNKEVQRALFSRGVGLSWREIGFVPPEINRIIWGNPSLDDVTLIPGEEGYGNVVWSNVLVTGATIKEVGGEPTKYECSLEVQIVGFGGEQENPVQP